MKETKLYTESKGLLEKEALQKVLKDKGITDSRASGYPLYEGLVSGFGIIIVKDINEGVTKLTESLILLPKGHKAVINREKAVIDELRKAKSVWSLCENCTRFCPSSISGIRIPFKAMEDRLETTKYLEKQVIKGAETNPLIVEIRLLQDGIESAEPSARPGDEVKEGEVIAETAKGMKLHSSIEGEVILADNERVLITSKKNK